MKKYDKLVVDSEKGDAKKMREIEFRGKQRDNGEWVYGSIISKYDADACGYCNFYIIETPDFSRDVDNNKTLYDVVNYGDYYEVKEETIGQYTGLKDKNGNKIFEGDIVKLNNQIGSIVYEEGCFGIGCKDYINYRELGKLAKKKTGNFSSGINIDNFIALLEIYFNFNDIDNYIEEIEVIGNIYDNTELIKGDEN